MRLARYLILSWCATAISGRHILLERQDVPASISISAAASTSGVDRSSTSAESAVPSQSSRPAATTSSAQSTLSAPRTTAPPGSFSLVPGSNPSATLSSPSTNETTTGDPKPLPLTPKLSPGIGLAGAVLLITGVAYGIIGIRNKYLYTFFGVAYPVALAVLVLILYCMNPPVSDGIQGAYFVAIFITGCLCGGVALVFRDLADGFGCLLGGFCLAMWFLTLKEGGTIPSTVGKAVFIGSLTVVVGALGLSHRTRKWGLIGSIPFSGATATILGIDCFSRAGMKEFWIYIWSINDDQFPLNTTTYPLTRGMKVEIAGIVILFLIGLVSQIKLSKILQERKKTMLERKAEKKNGTARDPGTMGTRVTSMLRNDQGRYESIYGNKSVSTLAVAPSSETVDKKGFSIMDCSTSDRGLEMDSMRPTSHRITVTNTEGETRRSQYLETTDKRLSTAARSTRSRTSLISNEQTSSHQARNRNSHSELNRTSSAPLAPEVVPLPFKIPGVGVNDARSRGSLSAIEEDFLGKRASAQRGSSGSWNRLSNRASGDHLSTSRESLMFAQDDDNASSVAATYDELDEDRMSLSAVTLPRSPMDETFSLHSPHLSNRASIATSLGDGQLSPRFDISFTDDAGALGTEPKTTTVKRDSAALSPTAFQFAGSDVSEIAAKRSSVARSMDERQDALAPVSSAASKRSSEHSDTRKSALSSASTEPGKLKIMVPQGPSQPLTKEILSERVVDSMSRVTLQYRTNEWAKHLENAQQPEEDAMSSPPSPGIRLDAMFPSVLEHATRSPVVAPSPISVPKPTAQRSSTDPTAHRRKKSRTEALLALTASSQPPLPTATNRQSSQRNLSSPQQSRPSSSSNMAWPGPAQRLSRQSSTPVFAHAVVQSPIEARTEDPRKHLQKRTSSSKGPKAESTLLAQRDSRLEAQPKSQSFAVSAPNLVITPGTPGSSVQGRGSPMPMQKILEGEAITRPATARQDSQSAHQPKPPSRQNSFNPSPVLSHEIQNFNSHQPQRRTSTGISASQNRREDLLTNWRESLREDQKPQKAAALRPNADEIQRARLLQEKRERQAARDQEKLAKARKEEQMSKMVQTSGDMVEAHKRALARMQSGAKLEEPQKKHYFA